MQVFDPMIMAGIWS